MLIASRRTRALLQFSAQALPKMAMITNAGLEDQASFRQLGLSGKLCKDSMATADWSHSKVRSTPMASCIRIITFEHPQHVRPASVCARMRTRSPRRLALNMCRT